MADPRFDSCRFDFRLDSKNGLTPSKRKRSERRGTCYNTLFKCKVCGSLFDNRASLLEHKLVHNEYKCPICGVKVARKATLREHLQVIHGLGKDKASPEEMEEEKTHKIHMKEQMNVVRGFVNNRKKGGKGGGLPKLLAPKPPPSIEAAIEAAVSGAMMMNQQGHQPNMMGQGPPANMMGHGQGPLSPSDPSPRGSPAAAQTPTTMQGYMCINVPIFVPSSTNTSTTPTSSSSNGLPQQPMMLPMMSSPGPMPMMPMPGAPGQQHMLLPVTQAPPPGHGTVSHAGNNGAMTIPVNSTNTPIMMSTPNKQRDSPNSDLPPLIPPKIEMKIAKNASLRNLARSGAHRLSYKCSSLEYRYQHHRSSSLGQQNPSK
jgi:predicted RNA-binding Zn-ribbon protein involved in translation (DUF1610 family)